MSQNIICISANTTPKRFVSVIHKREDGSFAMELTDNIKHAQDFYKVETANKFIERIFNPWERVFTAEEISVERKFVDLEMAEDNRYR